MEVSLDIASLRLYQTSDRAPSRIDDFIKNNPKLAVICSIALAILGISLMACTYWLIAPGLSFAWTSTGWDWVVLPSSLPASTQIYAALSGIAGTVSIAAAVHLSIKASN